MIVGIDPGPTTSGTVVYDHLGQRVGQAHSALALDELLCHLSTEADRAHRPIVAIERMQSYGQAGASLLDTARIAGRIEQRAHDLGCPVVLLYRRDILRALDVTGRGNRDALVRQRLLEMHPGGTGTKKAQGPLYGVSGPSWAALAVAVAAALGTRSQP